MAVIKAVVGLGNPGEKYARTLHNIGFWYVDELLRQFPGASFSKEKKLHGEQAIVQLGDDRLILLKPDTFMNNSGQAVVALCQFYKLCHQLFMLTV